MNQTKSKPKDTNLVRVRKFCRMLEKNMNNYIQPSTIVDESKPSRGFFLKIESVNGIKKIIPRNLIDDRNFYLRFFLTFYDTKTLQFYGSTFKSPHLKINFNENGYYELNDESLYVYFLAKGNPVRQSVPGSLNQQTLQNNLPMMNPSSKNLLNIQNPVAGLQGLPAAGPVFHCVMEIIFVETNKKDYTLSQTCEGWTMIEISQDLGVEGKQSSTGVFLGTPRCLLNKNSKEKVTKLFGASVVYSLSLFNEIEKVKPLLPDYYIIGYEHKLPGLYLNYLPKKPVLNEQIKLLEFSDIYLKNVEIEVSPIFETQLMSFANLYRKQKYELGEGAVLPPILIKERKLKCGLHNSYHFVNINGISNFVSLSKKENFLFYKGVHHIDGYFKNEYCAIILELAYTLSIPGLNNREENLNITIGYSVFIPEAVDMDNNFRCANMFTGPGETIYGDQLYEPLDADDKVIKVTFIISKNKESYDKTFKEKEIEEIKGQMESMKKSMVEEYNKMLNYKDKEKEELLKKKEEEFAELEARLIESKRDLKNIYGKDDITKEEVGYSSTMAIDNTQGKFMQRQIVNLENLSNDEKMNLGGYQSNANFQQKNNTNTNTFSNPETSKINTFDQNSNVNVNVLSSMSTDNNNINNMNNLNNLNNLNNFNNLAQFQAENKYQSLTSPNLKSDIQTSAHFRDLNYLNNSDYFNQEPNFGKSENKIFNRQNDLQADTNYQNRSNSLVYPAKYNTHLGFQTIDENPNTNNTNNTNNNTNNTNTKPYNDSYNKLDFYKKANTRYDQQNEKQLIPRTQTVLQSFNPSNNLNSQNYYDNNEFMFYKMFYQKQMLEGGLIDGKNNPKIVYEQMTKDISRRDKADLIAMGVLQLSSTETSDMSFNYAFEKELRDEKKANSFIFHFLSYKPLPDLKDYNSVPDKIFFRFNFWDFDFTSNVAVVSKPSSNVAPSSTPLILQRENSVLNAKSEEKEMKIQVDFDPSIDPYFDYKDFILYLLNKSLYVDIFSADSLLPLGFIKIPLKDLLRQGKPSVYHTKELEIYDEKFKVKAHIQILLKSIGFNSAKPFNYDPKYLKVISTKEKVENMSKKKKITSRPLDLDTILRHEKESIAKTLMSKEGEQKKVSDQNQDIKSLNSTKVSMKLNVDQDMQKRLRAMKYAGKSSEINSFTPFTHNLQELKVKQEKENEFFKTLNYAHRLKEMKKKEIISKTIQDSNKISLNLSLIMGQPFLTNFVIHNNYDHDELLHLVVIRNEKDEEKSKVPKQPKQLKQDSTISIVNSPEEWKSLTEKNSLVRPNDYSCISPQNYLVIRPNESIPILLKILSFDENMSNGDFTVWVYKKSGEPLYFLSVTVVKVFSLIDHSFRYFMPEGRHATIKVPNPFKQDSSRTNKLLENYICTDSNVNLQLDPTTNDFFYKLKINAEGYKHEFILFFYLNQSKVNLFSTWRFEIHSCKCIDVHSSVGNKLTGKLQIESEKAARTVKLFSSNDDILFFPEKFNSPMILVPNIPNEVKYIIYPKREENYDVIINLVDISARERVKNWLVRIVPEKPQINNIFTIDCKVNSVTNIKYEFTNTLNSWVIFNFESNNSDILNVIDSRLPFNANEKKYINISIAAQKEIGRAEVLVFVSDAEELFSDTILFQLIYK